MLYISIFPYSHILNLPMWFGYPLSHSSTGSIPLTSLLRSRLNSLVINTTSISRSVIYIKCHGTPPQGASIGELCALVYTLCIAYVSYIRVYHLSTPLTLMIDCVMSCRLLKYIRSAATILRLIILHYAFFFTTDT
jgi:hypothetical protein